MCWTLQRDRGVQERLWRVLKGTTFMMTLMLDLSCPRRLLVYSRMRMSLLPRRAGERLGNTFFQVLFLYILCIKMLYFDTNVFHRTAEYYRQRFRKNFAQLLEEDAVVNKNDSNGADNSQQASSSSDQPQQPVGYLSAQAPPSSRPPRRFCAVCGFPSLYSCTICGTRYCSLRCQETHMETRCLKWTV